MPPLPVLADTFRCTLNWHSDGLAVSSHNVIHVLAPGFSSDDVYDAWNTNVDAAMWEHTNVTTSVNSVDVLPLDGVTPTTNYPNSDVTNWRGAGATQLTIPVSALASLKTGLRGRSGRGRIFLPWVCEGSQNGGILSGTVGANMTTAWNAFRVAMDSAGCALIVASYTHSLRNTVLHISVEDDCGTQRRRQDSLRRSL